MPRQLRVEYAGAVYHVMSRGDRREKIFRNDVDRHDFIKTLAEACQKTGWQVHAYCLMPNHYHLVVETPDPNLVAGMSWLQSTYSIRLNNRHKLVGHVFSGRYKSQLVEGSGDGYLRTACDYVHLNPVRARMLKRDEPLMSYPWSSFGTYLAAAQHRPGWIRVDRLLGGHGIRRDNAPGRREFAERMEARRKEDEDVVALAPLRRGWCVGSDEFKRRMLQRIQGSLGAHHSGQMKREAAVVRAEGIVAAELKRRGWKKADLAKRRKNDPEKLEIAARVRRETTLTIKEIAARVDLGTSKGANANLHKYMKAREVPHPGIKENRPRRKR